MANIDVDFGKYCPDTSSLVRLNLLVSDAFKMHIVVIVSYEQREIVAHMYSGKLESTTDITDFSEEKRFEFMISLRDKFKGKNLGIEDYL